MTKEQLAEKYAENKVPNACAHTDVFVTEADLYETAEDGFIAGFEAAEPEWVSIQDNKPPTNILVLVSCEKEYDRRVHRFCTMSVYVPYLTVLEEDFMGDEWWEQGDYDDVTGLYYTPEGWYEWQSEPDVNHKITAIVTHWMPLPKLPEQ